MNVIEDIVKVNFRNKSKLRFLQSKKQHILKLNSNQFMMVYTEDAINSIIDETEKIFKKDNSK